MGVTLGRTANNDILVPHPSVSRFHAYFQQGADNITWSLVDAESKNGTFIGDNKLVPTRPSPLTDAAKMRFGEAEVRFFLPQGFVEFLRQAMGS